MQERRKHPRISVDLPATVRLSHHRIATVKIIELSVEGVRFLCLEAPGINSEVELRFSLPSHRIVHELRLMANVRHLFDVIAMTDKESDYRYVAGVSFVSLHEHDRIALEKFVTESSVPGVH